MPLGKLNSLAIMYEPQEAVLGVMTGKSSVSQLTKTLQFLAVVQLKYNHHILKVTTPLSVSVRWLILLLPMR